MKRLFLICGLLAGSLFGFAQIKTEPLATAIDLSNGLIYTLPNTVINMEVETRRIQETPGIYFQYAERYLGLTDVCQTESVRYEIVGFRLTTQAVPDLKKTYLINAGKGKNLPVIERTPEGFLKSINAPKESCPAIENTSKREIASTPKTWETLASSIFTKEMQQASSTAKMAELAAAQLYTIRDTRFNLLTQDLDKTPSDGHSYEIVLSELNRMEAYYLELFKGKQTESTETVSFHFLPEKETQDILFRFSQLKGILDKSNLGGSPIYLDLKKIPTISESAKVNISAKKGYSLYYCQPGKAQINISDENKTVLFSKEVILPQFGRVVALPASQIQSVELCPETGAIIRLGK
jgi:hypothetical protein